MNKNRLKHFPTIQTLNHVGRNVLLGCSIVLLTSSTATAALLPCDDVAHLIADSANQFSSIKSTEQYETGTTKSNIQLPDSKNCEISGSGKLTTFRCVWEYVLGDEQAKTDFNQYVAEAQNCLGETTTIRQDQPVNHPDSYLSYLFELDGTNGRISLKDKSQLNQTFIFFVIESR